MVVEQKNIGDLILNGFFNQAKKIGTDLKDQVSNKLGKDYSWVVDEVGKGLVKNDWGSAQSTVGHLVDNVLEVGVDALGGALIAGSILSGTAEVAVAAEAALGTGSGLLATAGAGALFKTVKQKIIDIVHGWLGIEKPLQEVKHFVKGEWVLLHRGHEGVPRESVFGAGGHIHHLLSGNEEFNKKAKAVDVAVARNKLDIGFVISVDTANNRVMYKDLETGEEGYLGFSDVTVLPSHTQNKLDDDTLAGGAKDVFFARVVHRDNNLNKQLMGASSITGSKLLHKGSTVEMVKLHSNGRAQVRDVDTGATKFVDHSALTDVELRTTNKPMPFMVNNGFLQNTGFHVGQFVWAHFNQVEFPTSYTLCVLEKISNDDQVVIRYALSGHSDILLSSDLEHVNAVEYKYVDFIEFADFQIAVCEKRAEGVILEKAEAIALDYRDEVIADIVTDEQWFIRRGEREVVTKFERKPGPGFGTRINQDPTTYLAERQDEKLEYEREFEDVMKYNPLYDPKPPPHGDVQRIINRSYPSIESRMYGAGQYIAAADDEWGAVQWVFVVGGLGIIAYGLSRA